MSKWVAFDVGGTFIDLVSWDGHQLHGMKVASAPASRLASAVLTAVSELMRSDGGRLDEVQGLLHGTTVATNTVIDGSGSRVGLVTTKGFRDVVEIGRMTRLDHFNLLVQKPRSLSHRDLRFEVRERQSASGEEITPLNKDDVADVAKRIKDAKVDAVAVSFINSFRNDRHEREAAELLSEALPGVSISISAEVSPEYGEYERTNTTILNEYLRAPVANYLEALEEGFLAMGASSGLRILQSNGGMASPSLCSRLPVRLLVSGPAAGVKGAAQAAASLGISKFITFDMGGTSTDICAVIDGKIPYTTEGSVAGQSIRTVMSDIRSIGAGGGSLARVDSTGSLHVGPESAGADPGPMCYGDGGQVATVTDANVVLGYLNPAQFAGRTGGLRSDLAVDGLSEQIAIPSRTSVEDSALGILRVTVTNMAGAVRSLLSEKGIDAREYDLVAFGGSGPVYAAFVAQEVGLRRVIVPKLPGLISAVGLISSEMRADAWRTVSQRLSNLGPTVLEETYRDLETEAIQLLGVDTRAPDVRLERRAEMCYHGQRNAIGIRVPLDLSTTDIIDLLVAELNAIFLSRYGFLPEDGEPELVNMRVFATHELGIDVKGLSNGGPDKGSPTADAKANLHRAALFPGSEGVIEVDVFDRESLSAGQQMIGGCLIEEATSTIVVPPGMTATVQSTGHIVITASQPS